MAIKTKAIEDAAAKADDKAKEAMAKVKAKEAAAAEKAKAAQVKADLKAKIEERQLPGIAKEVNARFDLATKAEGKADDHRLAAALKLASAKELCQSAGISFEKWCEANVQHGWENIKKLVVVGQSAEPAKALADLRDRTKVANKKLRDKKKAGALPSGSKGAERPPSPQMATLQAMEALDDKAAVTVAHERVAKAGMAVVSKTDFEELRSLRAARDEDGGFASVAKLKTAFKALSASDRMGFVEWAAGEIGFTVSNPLAGKTETVEELLDGGVERINAIKKAAARVRKAA